jgi:hypothetical protein
MRGVFPRNVVVLPIRAFGGGKMRLTGHLSATERAILMREMHPSCCAVTVSRRSRHIGGRSPDMGEDSRTRNDCQQPGRQHSRLSWPDAQIFSWHLLRLPARAYPRRTHQPTAGGRMSEISSAEAIFGESKV